MRGVSGNLDTIIPVFCLNMAKAYHRFSLLVAEELHPTAINYRPCPHATRKDAQPRHLACPGT